MVTETNIPINPTTDSNKNVSGFTDTTENDKFLTDYSETDEFSSTSPLSASTSDTVISKPLTESERLNTFRKLKEHALNDRFGIPKKLLRVDLIERDYEGLTMSEQNDLSQRCSLDIVYREGFPTLLNSQPLWSQFEHESDVFYTIFSAYLNNDYTADTTYSEIKNNLESNHLEKLKTENSAELFKGVRNINNLKNSKMFEDLNLDGNQIETIFEYYYWDVRCRAYDLFMSVLATKHNEATIVSTNNKHMRMASTVLTKLMNYIESSDFDENLTPQVATAALKNVAMLERIASGQGMQAGSTRTLTPFSDNRSIMEGVAEREAIGANTGEADMSAMNASVSKIMNDPIALEMAQELSMRFTTNEQQAKQEEDKRRFDYYENERNELIKSTSRADTANQAKQKVLQDSVIVDAEDENNE